MRKRRTSWLQLQRMSAKGKRFFRQQVNWDETWPLYFHGVSREQAEKLLDYYLAHTAAYLSRTLGAQIPQHQFDALVSWAESMPFRQFQKSRLRFNVRKLPQAVPAEMRKFVTQNGKWNPQLEVRRRNEARLFEKGYLN